jgi:cytoskeletal protein CcmA (bactofilin family)
MVWKKPENDPSQPEPVSTPQRPSYTTPAPVPAAGAAPPAAAAPRGDRATIGPSIYIKGDLAGEEDLVIEGRVEGRVDLRQHSLVIGKNGRVKADLVGRVVTVEGEVDGNVFAEEQAVVLKSGTVRGNISSPRVTLEDGSRFKGSIDMEGKEPARVQPSAAAPQPPRREHGPEPAAPRPAQEPAASKAAAGVTA